MLRGYLHDYGLSSEKINTLCKYFKDLEDIIKSEDYEVAAIGDISISEARKLKKFLIDKNGKKGIGGDFLKRWGETVSQGDVKRTYDEYQKLSKMYPNSPVIWQIRGELLEKMNRIKEAMKSYRRALELYNKRNELPPRELEEKIKGKVYHYRGNGNGYGLINGLGFQNGRNTINGFKNGFKNGIINGSGLVNGTNGRFRYGVKKNPPGRFLITLLIILLVLYAPLFATYMFEKHYEFRVDGKFGEWKSEIPYIDLSKDTRGTGNIDILIMKFHPSRNGIFFYIRTLSSLFKNSSGIYIFLDVDNLSLTGYSVGNIGAEYMVEIYGWNSSIRGRNLYFFNSTDKNNFGGFKLVGSIPAEMRKNEIEGFIPINYKKFRAIAISTDYHGRYDFSSCPYYGKKDFIMVEKNGENIIKLNEISEILKIETRSYFKVEINNMSFGYYGTSNPLEVSNFSLYEDNGNGIFDYNDNLISNNYKIKNGKIIFENLNLKIKNSTLFLAIEFNKSYLTGKTAMLYIAGIGSNILYSIDNQIKEASYIGEIPQDVHIDGSFEDWKIKKNDNIGDVINPIGAPVIGDENIDIVEYSAVVQNSLLFYINVNGKMLGGDDCPVVRKFVLPDSDRDTVPDRFDPLPYDFNNDGIPDNESYVMVNGTKLPDVDKDGIADYPYGNDMWLNTTIPSNFPEPYAGKKVHRYIGPVPVRKVYGEDTIRIYINSDNNKSTGFSLPDYPIGADYMVEVYGRDGKVENSSLNIYSHGEWIRTDDVNYAIGYHEIEINSNLSTKNATSIIIISDWKSDRDISDTPFFSHIPTRSNEVHKQLHLHYNATSSTPYLNTTCGSTAYYAQIDAGYTASWVQIPVFAKNFSISSYPLVHLYLKPHIFNLGSYRFIPGMNVSLWIYNSSSGYREIDYDYNPDIENEGWYNFTISNTSAVKKNENLTLNLTVTGFFKDYIDVYFNSTDYNSLIDLPTTTYINVDWIKTYNASGETDTFNSGENLHVEAEISDPFGSYDISNAAISIYYPNGTLLVNNATLNISSSTTSSTLFYFDYTLPSPGGVYEILVYGTESNGVVDSNTTYFIIRTKQGVALYPDQTKDGNPDENIYFNLTLENIGNINDTYEIIPSTPTSHFPFSLYINNSLVAEDNDGDGKWDWINRSWDPDNDGKLEITLLSLQEANITVVKNVPSGSWGETDLTIFNASSESNSSVYDTARIRVNVPYHSANKVLYLNDTDKLAVKHGTSTSQISLSNGDSYSWTFPQLYYSVNITSYILVHLYIDASGSLLSNVAMKVSLYYDSTLIGEDEITGNGAKWYNFTISPNVDAIPAGASIILNLGIKGLGSSATVYYNSSQYPSNITIPTTDYIKIRYLKLYNSSGYETYNFSAGEDVIVKTRIISPFGTNDIGIAYLNITDPLNNKKVDSQEMNLLSESGGDKIYNYTYSLPDNAWSGYWNVRVDVHDDPTTNTNSSTQFLIPSNVSVEPDHNITTNVSSQDRWLYFNHTITNTGKGANIFEITATSSNGFDIQLIINGNLAAEDYNGDGTWDYLNSSYDTDGDGNPDTGVLTPGESFNIIIAVKIPANYTGNETVDVEAYSFLSQSVNDHAYDKIAVVPEMNNLLPLILLVLIPIIKRRRRFILFSSQFQ